MNKKELFKLAIREFHERTLPDVIERDLVVPLDTPKVITIYGARRTGKTYYLYQLINSLIPEVGKERILFLNLEDERLLPIDVKEMTLLLDAYYELYPENRKKLIYIFLDEIQVVDGWEVFVRRLEETKRFRIIITGSSAKLLSREIGTSLRGRTLSYRLLPFSFKEYLRAKGIEYDPSLIKYSGTRYEIIKSLEEYLLWGGYPETVNEPEDLKAEILKNYFEMIIFRDLVERFSVRNTHLLKHLLKYLLTNISNLFTIHGFYQSLEPGLRPSRETLGEYLSYILEIEVAFLIPKFSYSLKVQQKNPRKVYSIDNGLRRVTAFVFSMDTGRLAENMVFLELLRRGYEIYYWKQKREVDFIARRDDETIAVNICYTDTPVEREIEGLKELQHSDLKVDKSLLVTRDSEINVEGIHSIPLWQWLISTTS